MRTRTTLAGICLALLMTNGCAIPQSFLYSRDEDTAMTEAAGKPHGLPTDDRVAARAEMRRRMIDLWTPLLEEIPTRHVYDEFRVEGGDDHQEAVLVIDFPHLPEGQWTRQNEIVDRALRAGGWASHDHYGLTYYTKDGYEIMGSCKISDCAWEMRSPGLPSIMDMGAGFEGHLPELARFRVDRGSSPTGRPASSPTR